MGTQKGKLFELARMYHTYQNKNKDKKEKKRIKDKQPVEVKGQHFDEGKSISLSYSFDMYPEVLYDSHQRNRQAVQMSFSESDQSEAFFVEPFESENPIEISHQEVNYEDTNEARLEKIAMGLSSNDEYESLKEDEEKLGEMEKNFDKMFEPKDSDSTAMEVTPPTPEEQKKFDKEKENQTPAVAEKTDQLITKKKEGPSPYEVSDEEFANDIGAILQGQKVYDAQQKKAVGRNDEKTHPVAKPLRSSDDVLDPNKNEHKIFEKIAQSMTYANSYDLGSIALEEKFEIMDREIEKEEVNKVLRTNPDAQPKTEAINDAHIIEERKEQAIGMEAEKYNPSVPLDHTNGGRLIKESHLMKGDLVLTSSSGGTFNVMDGPIGSESIAGLYIGNNKILTKGDDGSLEEKQLQGYLTSKGVMVALRHQGMSYEKGTSITDALTKLRIGPEKQQAENWVQINCPSINLHPDVCADATGSDKKKCDVYAGKINLGTLNNNSFLCADSIINAFEKNKVGFVPPLSKDHNGTLKYLGHLKNKA